LQIAKFEIDGNSMRYTKYGHEFHIHIKWGVENTIQREKRAAEIHNPAKISHTLKIGCSQLAHWLQLNNLLYCLENLILEH
jgi:hypothetical protein